MRVVQAFGQSSYTMRFRETNEAQFDANIETAKVATRYFPLMEFLGVGAMALVIGLGGLFADQGLLTVGTVAAFVLYLGNLFDPVQNLSQQYNVVQSAGAAIKKIFELLDEEPSIAERPDARVLPATGELAVRDVSFAYANGVDVLRDVTLTIAPGERIALVGPTGAGKSTLAKLVVRFYDPRAGSVSFGGVDLRDATMRSFRERIVVVPQEGFMFAGTVRDNVRVGRPDASDAEVEAAVEPRSGSVTGSSRCRRGSTPRSASVARACRPASASSVSLARAALADPTVLVLDEATSNLDPGTEQIAERALEVLTEQRTVVVVAHRLSTAARADRVAVVDGGSIAEIGTHDELIARGGRYAALVRVVVGVGRGLIQPSNADAVPGCRPFRSRPSRMAGSAWMVPGWPKCRLTIEPALTAARVRWVTASAPGSS